MANIVFSNIMSRPRYDRVSTPLDHRAVDLANSAYPEIRDFNIVGRLKELSTSSGGGVPGFQVISQVGSSTGIYSDVRTVTTGTPNTTFDLANFSDIQVGDLITYDIVGGPASSHPATANVVLWFMGGTALLHGHVAPQLRLPNHNIHIGGSVMILGTTGFVHVVQVYGFPATRIDQSGVMVHNYTNIIQASVTTSISGQFEAKARFAWLSGHAPMQLRIHKYAVAHLRPMGA